jgi:hypothetical protein
MVNVQRFTIFNNCPLARSTHFWLAPGLGSSQQSRRRWRLRGRAETRGPTKANSDTMRMASSVSYGGGIVTLAMAANNPQDTHQRHRVKRAWIRADRRQHLADQDWARMSWSTGMVRGGGMDCNGEYNGIRLVLDEKLFKMLSLSANAGICCCGKGPGSGCGSTRQAVRASGAGPADVSACRNF